MLVDGSVHYPANPNKFEFDAEVSAVFPNMARRSIPMYEEAHRAHVAMLRMWLQQPGVRVLDIGASRGGFLQQIVNAYGEDWCRQDMQLHAVDVSEPMCGYLRDDFPHAEVECLDITSPEFLGRRKQYEVVNMSYVLQFISPDKQEIVLRNVASKVTPDGVLILSQKDSVPGLAGFLQHEEYIEFRVRNGYTRQEIEAKTQALRNSMFPMSHERVRGVVKDCGFSEIQETTRWMVFSTLFCIK